jgi:hypothetical protein
MFEIVKIINDEPNTAWVIDTIEKEEDALGLARLYAEDHVLRAGVDNKSLRNTRYGAKFETNNGTPVYYTYRPSKGSDAL